MIGNSIHCQPRRIITCVLDPRQAFDFLDEGTEQVGVEVVAYTLYQERRAFQAQARINTYMRQRRHGAILLLVELREHQEASPNLAGMSALIKRPRAVTVRYLDESGVINRRDFVGLEATSIQHQIDHLNGRMYFDNLSKMKRDMLLRKARKQRSRS